MMDTDSLFWFGDHLAEVKKTSGTACFILVHVCGGKWDIDLPLLHATFDKC